MIEGTVSLKCSQCNHCEVCQWVDLKMDGCAWFEEEPRTGMSDLISRQAVDDAIYDYSRSCDVNYAQIMEYIEKIPSVTPAEKVGKWIMHIDDLFPADSTMECNKCHEHQPITIDDNYCPNCGAKMEE